VERVIDIEQIEWNDLPNVKCLHRPVDLIAVTTKSIQAERPVSTRKAISKQTNYLLGSVVSKAITFCWRYSVAVGNWESLALLRIWFWWRCGSFRNYNAATNRSIIHRHQYRRGVWLFHQSRTISFAHNIDKFIFLLEWIIPGYQAEAPCAAKPVFSAIILSAMPVGSRPSRSHTRAARHLSNQVWMLSALLNWATHRFNDSCVSPVYAISNSWVSFCR